MINGQSIKMDVSPQIKENKIYVPISWIMKSVFYEYRDVGIRITYNIEFNNQ